mgnify:FL=1
MIEPNATYFNLMLENTTFSRGVRDVMIFSLEALVINEQHAREKEKGPALHFFCIIFVTLKKVPAKRIEMVVFS